MPSPWERGAGVTQLTGWAHLPLQREVAAGALGERALQLRPARSPTALPALEPQKRLRLSRGADQGWGAEPAATDPPNLKFRFPPGPSLEGRVPPGVGGALAACRGAGGEGGSCGAGLRDEAGAWPALEGKGKGPRLLREAGLEASGAGRGGGWGTQEGLRSLATPLRRPGAGLQGPRLPPPRTALAFPEQSVCEDASLALGCKCLSRL